MENRLEIIKRRVRKPDCCEIAEEIISTMNGSNEKLKGMDKTRKGDILVFLEISLGYGKDCILCEDCDKKFIEERKFSFFNYYYRLFFLLFSILFILSDKP